MKMDDGQYTCHFRFKDLFYQASDHMLKKSSPAKCLATEQYCEEGWYAEIHRDILENYAEMVHHKRNN